MFEHRGGAAGLRTEISGELASALAAVLEASGDAGQRYDARVRRSLVQTVAARAYGRPFLELAFLIGAADRLAGRGGYIGFLWGVRTASASAYKAAALASARIDRNGSAVSAGATELVVRTTAPEYRISYGRIPFLAALLDFCVTALGFDAVDTEISAFLAGPRGRNEAQTLANALSRRLYEFLKQHLPSQQYERKFGVICGFLAERTGRKPLAESVDDRTVLAFWEQRCAQHSDVGDFRGFRTVALDCFRLRAALKAAAVRRAVESAAPIGPSREHGEVDPEQVLQALEVIGNSRAILSELASPPANRLKSVNKREAARLDLVLEAGEAAGVLPLTILRAEVFGAHQARIIQALRRRSGDDSWDVVDDLIGSAPEETYPAAVTSYRGIAEHLIRARKALMYILFRNRRPEALTIAISLYPDMAPALRSSIPDAKEAVGNVIPLRPEQAIGRLVERALSGDPETVAEAGLFRTARVAFARLNRRGFEECRVLEREILEAAEVSEPLVRECGSGLQDLLKALGRHFDLISPDQVFEEDCRRFGVALAALYREPA
ncbi:hypothetical protein [Nisaea sp.]|uniref:hypothetical protein n=1 Tax=Nisaea sp. TaxID=2024842 RepID=UPI003B52D968